MTYFRIFSTLLIGGLLCTQLVYGQEVLIESTATASSQSGQSRTAEKAVDGDLSTRWEASNSSPGSWLTLTFSAPTTVTSVSAVEYGVRIRSYEIQVKKAGQWSTAATGTNLESQTQINADLVSAVRLFVKEAYGQPSIQEFKAYANSGAVACRPYNGSAESVIRGEVDCKGQSFSGGGCTSGSQLFRLADGAKLKNAVILAGEVRCEGSCTLEDVHWRNYSCAATLTSDAPSGSTLTVNGGSATRNPLALPGRPFVINKRSSHLVVRNFRFVGPIGPFNDAPPNNINMPSTPVPYDTSITMENVRFEGPVTGPLVRELDTYSNKASLRGISISGYQRGNPVICHQYRQSMDLIYLVGEMWGTPSCDVSLSDVTALPINP